MGVCLQTVCQCVHLIIVSPSFVHISYVLCTFWVGLEEARAELTEMALGSETRELNATTAG